MQHGIDTLDQNGWECDYVITHCAPSSTQALLSNGKYRPDLLTQYLEEIRQKLTYKKWFFGHYHENIEVGQKYVMLYEMIIPLLEYLPEEDVQ